MGAPPRRLWVRLGIAVLVLALVGMGVLYGVSRYRAPAVDHAIDLVPADADAYFHAFLKPSTLQRRALQKLLARFPPTDDEIEAELFANELLRDVLAGFGLWVDRDAGEWLGEEAAAFLPAGSSEPVLLLKADDAERARAELEDALVPRSRHVEIEERDGFMIVGDGDALSRLRESEASLGDEEAYATSIDGLDEHRIALLYLSDGAGSLAPGLASWTGVLPSGSSASTLSVRENAIVVDSSNDGWSPSVRGYVKAALTGIEGGLTSDLMSVARARAAARSLEASLPETVVEVRRKGSSVSAGIGVVRQTEADPRAIAELVAAEAPPMDGYERLLAVDLGGLPTALRKPLAAPLRDGLRDLAAQLLTLDLGVRDDGDRRLTRLVATFSDA